MNNRQLGNRIQKLRKEKRLTQDEMAAQLQTRGVDISRGTYSKIETGIRKVSVQELKAIKAILKTEWTDLLD